MSTPPLPAVTARPADDVVSGLLDLPEARGLALDALLRLAGIEWDARVGTACVECVAFPRMLLNPEFVATRCDTTRKLAFVILHELGHVSLGHSGLTPRMSPVQNIAFDAVINASLLQGIADRGAPEGWEALVTEMYDADESPAFILRPPPGWPDAPRWDASQGLSPVLRSLHRRLYGRTRRPAGERPWEDVTYGEIVEALQQAPGSSDDAVAETLLGSHGATDREIDAHRGARDHAVAEALSDVLSRLPGDPGRAGSPDGSPMDVRIGRGERDAALVQAIARLCRSALVPCESGQHWMGVERLPITSVDPSRDRRAAVRRHVARVLGAPKPVLFAHESVRMRRMPDRRVAIYLDVSGSMTGVLGPLYAALQSLRRLLAPRVFVFSTEVVEVERGDFLRGHVRTTGGTAVTPVLRHLTAAARAGRVQRAVLLTDGLFAPPPPDAVRDLHASGAELHLGVIGSTLHRQEGWVASATPLPSPRTRW